MDIWAMATGNEPASAKQIKFQILSWNPDDQARWIAQHLGPTLEKSKFNCELHGFDDNRDLAPVIFKNFQIEFKIWLMIDLLLSIEMDCGNGKG